jgi:hypothetical protein
MDQGKKWIKDREDSKKGKEEQSTKERMEWCEKIYNESVTVDIADTSTAEPVDTDSTVRVKLSLCFNWAPRHEGVIGEWRYSSTHSWPRH